MTNFVSPALLLIVKAATAPIQAAKMMETDAPSNPEPAPPPLSLVPNLPQVDNSVHIPAGSGLLD
ncbi:MAG: hypothetical protein ACREJU_10955 [Nitrospiraceae bacterium]